MVTKKWYASKTIWLNVVALIVAIVQIKTGLIISGEAQGVILTILNLILRAITNEEIVW